MQFGRFVDQFHADLARCRSQAELGGLLAATLRELGFDYFALLHHASLTAGGARLIRIDNYPPG